MLSFLGQPPRFEEAVTKGLKRVSVYPDPDSRRLVRTATGIFGINDNSLCMGNGAVELISALLRGLKAGKVRILNPTFSEYARAARMAGSKICYYHRQPSLQWRLLKEFVQSDLDRADALVLCNPNNSTGTLCDRALLTWIYQEAQSRGCLVIIDEAFMNFVEDFASPNNYSLLRLAARSRNLAVIRSFTKFFAVPGLRLGCLGAAPPVIELLRRCQEPGRINCVAQTAGEALVAPEGRPFRDRVRLQTQKTRASFLKNLERIPRMTVYPSPANYIFTTYPAHNFKPLSGPNWPQKAY